MEFLTRKLGPLPMWAWIVGGVGVLLIWDHYHNKGSNTATTPVGYSTLEPYPVPQNGGGSGGGYDPSQGNLVPNPALMTDPNYTPSWAAPTQTHTAHHAPLILKSAPTASPSRTTATHPTQRVASPYHPSATVHVTPVRKTPTHSRITTAKKVPDTAISRKHYGTSKPIPLPTRVFRRPGDDTPYDIPKKNTVVKVTKPVHAPASRTYADPYGNTPYGHTPAPKPRKTSTVHHTTTKKSTSKPKSRGGSMKAI